MSKVLNPDAAKAILEATTHFRATTTSQHNRGHLRDLVALAVTTGAKDAEYFDQFGISQGDIGCAVRGERIEGIDDRARDTIITELDQTARQALGWDL